MSTTKGIKTSIAKEEERQVALSAITLPFLGCIAAIFWAWRFGLSLLDLELFLGMYVLTTLGVTAGFHRLFTHRSFEAGKVIQVLLAIAGSMAVQGPVIFWVASHRKHHQYSDQQDDLHSPHFGGDGTCGSLKGFYHSHMGWMLNHDSGNWVKYVPDLLRDQLLFKLNQWYFYWVFLGLLLPAILGALLTRTWQGTLSGLLWGGFARIFIVHHVTWSINSICHLFGSQPYATMDRSRNNFIFGILALGEGWHNNHHAFQNSARHGLLWWQLDLTYILIFSLERCSLVWNVKLPAMTILKAKRLT